MSYNFYLIIVFILVIVTIALIAGGYLLIKAALNEDKFNNDLFKGKRIRIYSEQEVDECDAIKAKSVIPPPEQ